MRDNDLLSSLFQAHRDGDHDLFVRTARLIINRELAANHHETAQQLIRALSATQSRETAQRSLMRLPQRVSAEGLITYPVSRPGDPDPILCRSTRDKIDRILLENRLSDRLYAHQLWPANRLLLWGPPGCGKTLTAGYIARELGLPLGIVDLSGLITGVLGATASQMTKVFSIAKSERVVLLLDEFDALSKERDDEFEIGESKRIVNSVLQNLEGFQGSRSILVAASNHQYLLDRAVWRRFDDVIEFPLPTGDERGRLLQALTAGVRLVGSLTLVIRRSANMSFADIALAVRYALKTAALENDGTLSVESLLQAIAERKHSIREEVTARLQKNEQRTSGTRTKRPKRL